MRANPAVEIAKDTDDRLSGWRKNRNAPKMKGRLKKNRESNAITGDTRLLTSSWLFFRHHEINAKKYAEETKAIANTIKVISRLGKSRKANSTSSNKPTVKNDFLII